MAEHRVHVLSGSLSRYSDPSRSRDPNIRAVVRQLSGLEVAPPPSAHFRAELRAQLVAVAPRLVREGEAAPRPTPVPAALSSTVAARLPRAAPALRRLAHVHVGRPVTIALGTLCVFALLLSGAVWISHKALPGDTLYGLKRASESAELSLASGATARAKEYLSFAETRVDEVAALLGQPTAVALGPGPHAAGGVSARTATLVTDTLDSADSDLSNAARLLGAKAVKDSSAQPLAALIGWTPGQLNRLHTIAARAPAGATHRRVLASAQLVAAALTRAQALRHSIGCACLAAAPTDNLGPVPCTDCAAPEQDQRPNNAGTSGPSTPTSTASTPPHSSAARTGGAGAGSAGESGTSTGSMTHAPQPHGNQPGQPNHAHTSAPAKPGTTASTAPANGAATTTHTQPGTTGGGSSTSRPVRPPTVPNPGTTSPTHTCLIYLLGICVNL